MNHDRCFATAIDGQHEHIPFVSVRIVNRQIEADVSAVGRQKQPEGPAPFDGFQNRSDLSLTATKPICAVQIFAEHSHDYRFAVGSQSDGTM